MLEIDEYRKQRGMNVGSQNEEAEAKFQDTVVIKEIEWKYQGTEKNVLQNISMEIKRGEAIGLIGKSGSGKNDVSGYSAWITGTGEGNNYYGWKEYF